MLNISKNRIDQLVKLEQFKSGQIFKEQKHYQIIRKIIWAFVIMVILFLFLPWTQNIQGAGNVTTLKPNQRPQTIHTAIAGRIEKWYVNEGDFVKKGDTILFISEIKEDYFDPNLVQNTKNQVDAKSLSLASYEDKVTTLSSLFSSTSVNGFSPSLFNVIERLNCVVAILICVLVASKSILSLLTFSID